MSSSDSSCVLLQSLPTQDMFFSYFLTRCSEFRIRKPNRWILSMLENFGTLPSNSINRNNNNNNNNNSDPAAEQKRDGLSLESRALAADFGARGQQNKTAEEESEIAVEKDVTNKKRPILPPRLAAPVPPPSTDPDEQQIPFSQRTELIMPHSVVLGTATLKILVEMMYFMPKLEIVDFSACRFFDADPTKLAPTGNEVLVELFEWAAVHGAVSVIDIGGGSQKGCAANIGTSIAAAMLRAATSNPRLLSIVCDERGVEKNVLHGLKRVLRLNHATSPISTAIRSIRDCSPPELSARMRSMAEHGTLIIDRKSSSERQLLLTVLYDRSKLFAPLLMHQHELQQQLRTDNHHAADNNSPNGASSSGSGDAQTAFVAPARQWLLSECLKLAKGVRGDGKHLFVVSSGAVTVRIGSYEVRLERGDIFGEEVEEGVFFQTGAIVKRTEHGAAFMVPHSVCRDSLFCAWQAKVRRFLPIIKSNMALNALPIYIQARCCYDAQLVTMGAGRMAPAVAAAAPDATLMTALNPSGGAGRPNSTSRRKDIRERRVIRAGDTFSGLFVVVAGRFRIRTHKHVAKFMQSREEARQLKEAAGNTRTNVDVSAASNNFSMDASRRAGGTPAGAGAGLGFCPDLDPGALFGEEALINRRKASTVHVDAVDYYSLQSDGGDADDEREQRLKQEWQLLQLDPQFCSTVLLSLMKPVLSVQAREYGAEWKLPPEEQEKMQLVGNNEMSGDDDVVSVTSSK